MEGVELTAGESITITQYANTSVVSTLPYFIAQYTSHIKQQGRHDFYMVDNRHVSKPQTLSPHKLGETLALKMLRWPGSGISYKY